MQIKAGVALFGIDGGLASLIRDLALRSTRFRHGRACPGHPRRADRASPEIWRQAGPPWMPGNKPGMTTLQDHSWLYWAESQAIPPRRRLGRGHTARPPPPTGAPAREPLARALRYVVATAECGNVTEAARRLNVSQPSVSAAIRRQRGGHRHPSVRAPPRPAA